MSDTVTVWVVWWRLRRTTRWAYGAAAMSEASALEFAAGWPTGGYETRITTAQLAPSDSSQ